MTDPQLPNGELDALASSGVRSLLLSFGAFFAFLNSRYGWVGVPDYPRLSDVWYKPLQPFIAPYSSALVITLGIAFLVHAGICFCRCALLERASESAP